jgi:RNA polymerase sigma-70 factor (ECF subfamily)
MAEQVSDITLLERFVSRREQEAFAALYERHGPVVSGICRRVLRDEHDVEDVLQATFLVLARKAARLPWRGSVGSWLCTVAHRIALGTRADVARYQRRESTLAVLMRRGQRGGNGERDASDSLPDKVDPLAEPALEAERRDLRDVINHELLQLPEKYRAPLVLCYLEGMTHQQAARRLGWPAGSVSRRLHRARSLLRGRLARRGVSLLIAMLAFTLALLAAWSGAPPGRRAPAALPQALFPHSVPSHGSQSIESLLDQIARGGTCPDSVKIAVLARQTAESAQQLDRCDPGRLRADWRLYTTEMRHWALQLALASQRNEESEILVAARRLDATCLKCHEVFRQE